MAKIKPLPALLANQIAAGEVIDRPASVVKELLENSLDAHATSITIDLNQGGAARISILDDGEGIEKDDLALALQRHATSKVKVVEDLNNILSLGFRGEALASIASVAKCVLTSKPKDQTQAWSCSVKGHEQKPYVFPAPMLDGTQLVIQDLFYNVPARRKFLKSPKTEMNHIEHVVKKAALSHPEVSFLLNHNEKAICHYKKTQSWARRVEQVCGKKFMDNAYELQVEHGEYQLRGWLGTEHVFRKHADCQYFFINQRPVRDKILQHAIKNAFFQRGYNLEQNFPSFVLFLECPAGEVDVNVHPTKHEVRFHDPSWVHDFIQKCLIETLKSDAPIQQAHQSINPSTPIERPSALTEKAAVLYESSTPTAKPTTPNSLDNATVASSFPRVSLELDMNHQAKSKHQPTLVFWHHYLLVFKESLWVLDLKQYQTLIWRKLIEEAKRHPWPSRLTVFPMPVQRMSHESTWEALGVKFRKNLTGKWQCVEAPAFLDMTHVTELAKYLESLEDAYAFLEQIPWTVFTSHPFFQGRFCDWLKTSFDWFESLDKETFATSALTPETAC